MAVDVLTFGCRLNTCESELMRERATEAGVADATLVNTCAVTAEAVRQARQAIRRAKRERPGRRIVVSGCAAQTEPGTFAAMPEVDLVIGNTEKLTAAAYRAPVDFGAGPAERVRVDDIMSVREFTSHTIAGMDGRARAFVQVQNGCDHRCTFCIIPFGRGNSRSVPMGEVIRQVHRLVERGYREVVLTGVDITSYGADLPGAPRLGALVRTILRLAPELKRLRLSSIDSIEADPDLLRAIAEEERLMPHIHLSLQSGDDVILKRMKRRHRRSDSVRFCDDIRKARPDVVFGADLIAGFPTETDEMFDNTLALIADCGLTQVHVFPFSPRAGTPAARMPQVDRHLAKSRAQRLREAGAVAVRLRHEGEIGKHRTVLLEANGFGRTEHFAPVRLPGFASGRFVETVIRGNGPKGLVAEALRQAA